MRSLAGSVVIVIICFVAVAAVKWRDETLEQIYAGMRNYNYHLLKTGHCTLDTPNTIMQEVSQGKLSHISL